MLWWVAQNTVMVLLLACIVALVCRLGRLNPAVRHALWLLLLIKLVMPPVIEWPWALPAWIPLLPAEVASAAPAPTADEVDLAAKTEQLTVLLKLAESAKTDEVVLPGPADADPDAATLQTGQTAKPGWWHSIRPASAAALDAWLIGTLCVCALQLVRIVRLQRLVARGTSAPDWLIDQVETLAGRVRVRAPLSRIVQDIDSPLVWNLGRRRLIWPDSLLESMSPDARASVIVHELAHLRRRDDWVAWLEMLAGCIWWWNPLYWYVRRQLRLNAELACDAWVVAILPENRRAYAEALIEVTQHVSQRAALAPAVGMSSGARQAFERRLIMIMRERVPCRVPIVALIVMGILGLAAMPGWSQVQVRTQPAETAKAKQPEPVKGDVLLSDVQGVSVWALDSDSDDIFLANSDPERDRKLRDVEQKIQKLLEEVRALRGGVTETPPKVRVQMRAKSDPQAKPSQPHLILRKGPDIDYVVVPATPQPHADTAKHPVIVRAARNVGQKTVTVHVVEGEPVVTLTRTTYKLPRAKAETLVNSLRELVKAPVIETRLEGDSLTVTTTPDAQKAIGQLIALIQGKTTAAVDAVKPNDGYLDFALELEKKVESPKKDPLKR